MARATSDSAEWTPPRGVPALGAFERVLEPPAVLGKPRDVKPESAFLATIVCVFHLETFVAEECICELVVYRKGQSLEVLYLRIR